MEGLPEKVNIPERYRELGYVWNDPFHYQFLATFAHYKTTVLPSRRCKSFGRSRRNSFAITGYLLGYYHNAD